MNNDFDFLVSLWKNYNNASELLVSAMGGTSNEVGEFAERLVAKYYNAEQFIASNKSADLKTSNNKLIQVKSRKIDDLITTSLNVIRSWDFNILVVVLFSKDGNIIKAIEIDSEQAKNLSKYNKHQNGYILTTSKKLLESKFAKDITQKLQCLLSGFYEKREEVKKNKVAIDSKVNQDSIKSGEYIRNTFIELVNNNRINEYLIDQLQKENYCENMFGLHYAFLIKIASPKDNKNVAFINGNRRYGKTCYTINNELYLITNDLYKGNVDKFKKWFETL